MRSQCRGTPSGSGLSDSAITSPAWGGLENLLMDFYEAPDGIHGVMRIPLGGTMERPDFLESNGLLCLNNDGSDVGSWGMGFIDTLPAADFKGHVRRRTCGAWRKAR